MKVKKILIGRVFNWGKYENLRVSFEYELEDGDLENEIILRAFEELLTINEILQKMNQVREKWIELLDTVYPYRGQYLFKSLRDTTYKKLGEKTQTLECLKNIDKIPDACRVEIANIPISKLEDRRKAIEKEIEELKKKLEKIDEVEKEFRKLEEDYDNLIIESKEAFIRRKYDKTKELLESLEERIDNIKAEISSLKSHYW